MSLRLSTILTGLSLSSIAVIAACSATSSDSNAFNNGSGGSATAGGSGGQQADASQTTGGSAGSGGLIVDAPLGESSMDPDSACVAEHAQAEKLPLDLYIMVDRSASMQGSKWANQSQALKTFFQDPQSDGLYIAMKFFPLNDACSPVDPSCSDSAYAKPLVDWGVLPGHASNLVSAINGTGPDGCFTPTQEALTGLLEGAKQRQISEPLHVVAAVFASDGEPCCDDCPCEKNGCIGAIAGQYANGSPPIKTFAIAADPSAMGVLTSIAQQGGTTAPFDATGSAQKFIDALNAIRGSMVACEYKMPVPEAGTINPKLVQIEFTPSTSNDPVEIPKKNGASDCGNDPGWYYDNDTNPTKIILCPSTCSLVQGDDKGKLDILFGCSGSQT
jgi:hypothetical protein